MEPHFIFNTLSALQSSKHLNKNEEAINYLSRFGRLLRSSLELSREQTVPLGDEIEALENYLNRKLNEKNSCYPNPDFHIAIL